jgi:DNA polymerase-3 subunit gamma/tau
MDQAIAGAGAKLAGEQVRGLLGSAGPEVLEELLGTVAASATDAALRLLDKLMAEGHNPAHLARQLVRLLRNTLVAKVAGDDSALLQISADERARVGRIATQFSEEDLARFLQIMLRTFDDLGYRQEQRFHLELGVLKMVHAQRILPLEQVLSQVAAAGPKAPGASRQPATAAPASSPDAASVRKAEVSTSLFEADRARKGRSFDPEMSATKISAASAQPAGAAAVALAEAPEPTSDANKILAYVLAELEKTGNDNLVSTLQAGTATLEGNELVVTVSQPASVIPFIMSAEQKGAANAAAGAAAGRPIKVRLESGAPAAGNGSAAVRPVVNGTSARSRAAEEPVVQRMREKFGAEIRTVIDHRNKN